jgi:hypothetical protein
VIFRLAGIVGVEPWSFTFGELAEMAESRQRSEWDQAASIIAMIHNANVSKKHHAKPPKYFHPMHRGRSRAKKLGKRESMAALKAAFIRE